MLRLHRWLLGQDCCDRYVSFESIESSAFASQQSFRADINQTERSARSAELVMASLPSSGRIVSLETEDGRLQLDAIQPLMDLSRAGCERVRSVMMSSLAAYADTVMNSRGVQYKF